MTRPLDLRPILVTLWALCCPPSFAFAASLAEPSALQQDPELEELLAEFRVEIDLLVRRGEWDEARAELEGLLAEDPEDWRSRVHLARLEWIAGRFPAARQALAAVAERLAPGSPEALLALETELELCAELAQTAELGRLLERIAAAGFELEAEARLAWPAARALLQAGERERARALIEAAAEQRDGDWRTLLASGRAARWLGDLERASRQVVAAARVGSEREAEILAELASIYFEAEGEGTRRVSASNSPGELFREALERDPKNETALLGLHQLGKVNWRRQRTAASEYLAQLLEARPASIEGLLALGAAELELGRLRAVRDSLGRLEALAPQRREVRTLRATLAWVEHDRDEARRIVERLIAADPVDSGPERELGTSLVELYRFAEGLEFLRAAVERDPTDHRAWTQLGRALANTGDVEAGLEALDRAAREAAGRHDVWRENSRTVLEHITTAFVEHTVGDLTFAWNPVGAEVLAAYLVPFYADARRELAARYGYSSGPVRIEVFDVHADFSVRSTGFQGFPALGVCFGPVVTAVSPLSELRGSFSWARTSYHEFTHVVHLGISNNRCPRWITEGLATWEEQRVDPAWGRNMRRDLLDARANDQIFPLRELNAAFRGPRIIFGYYQGGLLCEMLIAEHGFTAMIRLLEAFDRGLDLDQACAQVFDATPEEIDRDFRAFVDAELEGLYLEPRFDPTRALALRYTRGPEPPADPSAAREWAERWLDVAFAAHQSGKRVDAEDALRLSGPEGQRPRRALKLEGQLLLADQRIEPAMGAFRRYLEAGGEDYFVRLALADHAWNREDDQAAAERHLLAAEAAFPGFDDPQASAELALAKLYDARGDQAAAMAARMRWLGYNADAGELRLEVARWLAAEGRRDEAERYFDSANQVDPFRTGLHRDWAEVLFELGRHLEVLREVDVALAIAPELDADGPGALDDAGRARLVVLAARSLAALGREDEARQRLEQARQFDPEVEVEPELVERLGS